MCILIIKKREETIMKRVCIVLSTLLLTIQAVVAINIEKIEPPFWYVGMENKELQLI